MRSRLLPALLFPLVLGGLLFGVAGRIDLPFFWAWLAVPTVTGLLMVHRLDPDLMKERWHPGAGGLDRHTRVEATPFWLVQLVIAGLDVGRYHWSDSVPIGLRVVGLVMVVAGYAVAAWAISINRFFSPVVRIQSERGHVVVTDGPYRWVRHPAYAAILLGFPAASLMLGSWWSLVPLIPVTALILRRTVVEDRFLQQHLDGYAEYARRVRSRLIPGVW